MTHQSSNDNVIASDSTKQEGPDAHGQAAILLAESLIHGLIARSIISVAEAIEIIGIATEVKVEVADEMGDSHRNMEKSLTILRAIGESLNSDLPTEPNDGSFLDR